jgi:hypothetical protein
VLQDELPDSVEVIRVSTSAPYTLSGQVLTIFVGTLAKGPGGLATVDVRLSTAVPSGTVVTNTATLTDNRDVSVTASDAFVVRPATAGKINCAFRAQVYARPGSPLRYVARYKNAGTNNVLTISLPSEGFRPVEFVPPPTEAAGTLVEYRELARTAGLARIDGSVDSSLPDGTVLYSWASVASELGDVAVCEHRSVVRRIERLTTFIKLPSKWRRGTTSVAVVRYSGATEGNELIVNLPAFVEVVSSIPSPVEVAGSVVRFQALPTPAGLVKLRLRLRPEAGPGTTLTISAVMTDASGLTASSLATTTLVP